MDWKIVEDSAECMAQGDGTQSVAVVAVADDGTETLDSCHADMEAAAARIDDLVMALAEPMDDDPASVAPEMMDEVVSEASIERLERAAALADRVSAALGLLASLADSSPVDWEAAASTELTEIVAEFTAIQSHSTATSDDPWDAAEQEVKVTSPSDEAYYAEVYAWRDDEADTSVKSSYRFIHHFVGDDGGPQAASTVACSAGIGVLNGGRGGTTIPDADRKGVYDHLARHLVDAGREAPALMSQDSYEAALEASNAALAAELAVPAAAGGLGGMADEELIAELARRWATDLVERLHSDGAATEFGGMEIEINVGGKEEEHDGEHEYPEGCEMCPMCHGSGEVVDAGMTVMCPECAGEGYVESEETVVEDEGVAEVPAPVPGPGAGMEAAVDGADEAAPKKDSAWDWEGVLIVEGIPSGDGRMIAEEALTWRELPIPLMLQTVNAPGHDGAVIAGSIHEIVRDGQNVVGRGRFDSGAAGQEAQRLLTEGTMRGVSADIDSVVVEFLTPDGQDVSPEDMMFAGVDALEVLVEGRIMGATLTPFPAFQEAHVRVLDAGAAVEDVALVASGAEVRGDVWRVPSPLGAWLPGQQDAAYELAALVASASHAVEVPVNPPREWFQVGQMEQPQPFTVYADGRCYGLVAQWGTCHIGFTDRCVPVPKSGSAYKSFRNKNVLTAEGDLVATGPIFMDTVHPDLRLRASDTQAFYADTGCAVADVALYENEFGIVAAGAVRPGLTPEQLRRFRGSDVSPDWRQLGGRLEVVGLLCVNVSGFIVEGLVASGASVPNARGVWDSTAGQLTALVAAGMVRRADTQVHTLADDLAEVRAELAEIREALRPMRAERAAERFARLAQAFSKSDDHGCGCGGGDVCACDA
jgi:hypothetical protein